MSEDARCKTETYQVTVTTEQREPGRYSVYEEWRLDGYIHRDPDLPAMIRRDLDTGSVRLEAYLVFGEYHRDEDLGPAVITYHPDGSVRSQEWYKNGLVHRDNGPARVDYSRTGFCTGEMYRKEGEPWDCNGYHTIVRDSKTGEVTLKESISNPLGDLDGPGPEIEPQP